MCVLEREEPIDNIEAIFKKSGAILEGHFLLTSGRHSPIYWEKFRIFERPEITQKLGAMIAAHFAGERVEVVAGPTTGGIILAHEVARQLGISAIFAEKDTAGRTFRRGLRINPEQRILVVDDVLTTGKSVSEVIEAVKKENGKVIGVAVLVDRSEEEMDFGFPLYRCLRTPLIPTYTASDCPLCTKGVPLIKPGSSNQSMAGH
jgi:orotate phosphoribosyltransferase